MHPSTQFFGYPIKHEKVVSRLTQCKQANRKKDKYQRRGAPRSGYEVVLGNVQHPQPVKESVEKG